MGQQNKKQQKEEEIDFESQFLEDNSQMKVQERMQQAYRISSIDRKELMKESSEKLKYEGTILYYQDEQSMTFTVTDFRLSKGQNMKQQNSQNFTMYGILQKQSPNILGSWNQRYCVLSDHKFVYHEKDMKESPEAGILNFDLLSCEVKIQTKWPCFKICVHQSQKEFVFMGQNPQITKEWAYKLKQITDNSLGRKYKLTYLSHYHRFWRKNYLSEKEFRETSESGDLILMRGNKNSAILQRAITQQQFDHVAVVLKNVKDEVLLFEASGVSGVGIIPWRKFISKKWYKDQDIVVFRKLNIKRNQAFYNEIEEFVQRNMGRKYKFSVKQYISNRSSSEEDNKTYFCSSLVAKLYKNLQLLHQQKSSTQYLPHTFSEKQALSLRKDGQYGHAYLDKQKIIVFEEQFLKDN